MYLEKFNYKKIFLVMGFVVVCLALLFLIYWMFFRTAAPQPGEPGYLPPGITGQLPEAGSGFNAGQLGTGGQLPQTGNLPATNTGGQAVAQQPDSFARGNTTYVLPLSADKTVGVALSPNKQGVVYYDKNSSQFYRLSADGKEKLLLSDEKFFAVENVVWSADSTQAIMTFPDGIKVYYNFATKKKTTLPKEVKEPVFNLSGSEIAFKYEGANAENNFVAIANPDGNKVKYIEDLGEEGNKVQTVFSPKEEVVAFYAKPSGLNSSEVFFIGQESENYKSLKIQGTRFKALWAPSGEKIIYQIVSQDTNYNPALWLTDARGDNIGNNNIALKLNTWVDKCVFASTNEIYCAVPKNLPQGSGLYPELSYEGGDDIYRVDLGTGQTRLLALPVEQNGNDNFKISHLSLAGDGRSLFFWNENNEQIYSLKLK